MQSIRQVQKLNDLELEKCIPPNASWHTDYRDTAYIYVGGLPFELSEGDVLIIFSQYGNPVHINLVRDKETGKSRGFAFLKYEDQRSCDLAVDNLSGASVLGKVLSVDHTRYKKKEGEVEGAGLEDDTDGEDDADATDTEDRRKRKRSRRQTSESASEGERRKPRIKEVAEVDKFKDEHDEEDPMKAYLLREKENEAWEVSNNKEKRRHHRNEDDGHRSRRKGDDREQRKSGHRSRREHDDKEDDEEHERSKRRRSRRERESKEDDYEDRKERLHKHRRSTPPESRRHRDDSRDKGEERPRHRSRPSDSQKLDD